LAAAAFQAAWLCWQEERTMANKFGADILIQAEGTETAAAFYVNQLGLEITGTTPMVYDLTT
jgi:hypothetical protein